MIGVRSSTVSLIRMSRKKSEIFFVAGVENLSLNPINTAQIRLRLKTTVYQWLGCRGNLSGPDLRPDIFNMQLSLPH